MQQLAIRRQTARAIALVISAGALASCTLLVSTDHLSDESSAVPLPDAGNEAPNDAGANGADAARPDAVTPIDAGGDGAPALSFCKSLTPAPTFCADFDDGRPLGDLGDVVGTPPTIETTNHLSGTSSMRLELPAAGASDSYQMGIDTHPPITTMTSYDVACAVRIGPTVSAAYTQILSLRFVAGTDRFSLVAAIDHGKLDVAEEHGPTGSEPGTIVVSAALPTTATGWVRIRFHGMLGAAAPTMELDIEGAKVDLQPLPAAPTTAATTPDLVFGVYFSGSSQPAKIFEMDDVVFDVH